MVQQTFTHQQANYIWLQSANERIVLHTVLIVQFTEEPRADRTDEQRVDKTSQNKQTKKKHFKAKINKQKKKN